VGRSPALHPRDVLGAAEVVTVLRLLQPSLLAVGFAGFTAGWFCAVALPPKVARIRQEQLLAMTTFLSRDCDHRLTPPREADVSGSFSGGGRIKSLEENAEENKKMGLYNRFS
jgi:hypothetical protein